MNTHLLHRIKTIVSDTYLNYYEIDGAQAFDSFISYGETAYVSISSGTLYSTAYVQGEMLDLYHAIAGLFSAHNSKEQ